MYIEIFYFKSSSNGGIVENEVSRYFTGKDVL